MFLFCLMFAMFLCARMFICALWSPAGKGLTSWLSFVVSNCEFVTFPLCPGSVWYLSSSHTYTSIALDTRRLAKAYQPSQKELSSPGNQKSSRGLIRGLIPGLIFSCLALPSS